MGFLHGIESAEKLLASIDYDGPAAQPENDAVKDGSAQVRKFKESHPNLPGSEK